MITQLSWHFNSYCSQYYSSGTSVLQLADQLCIILYYIVTMPMLYQLCTAPILSLLNIVLLQVLAAPNRVLVGEGVLQKQCRKQLKPRQVYSQPHAQTHTHAQTLTDRQTDRHRQTDMTQTQTQTQTHTNTHTHAHTHTHTSTHTNTHTYTTWQYDHLTSIFSC